jgi:aminopeptidase-like protein
MTPAEIYELWEGREWMRNRDLEAAATAIFWLRTLLDGETEWVVIAESMGVELTEEHRKAADTARKKAAGRRTYSGW